MSPTIFQRPFWLDAVAPNEWQMLEVKKGGSVQASMPIVLRHSRHKLKSIVMPLLTQTLGPWFAAHESKYVTQLSWQHEMMAELIGQLPPFDLFQQRFHYSIKNWLPFYWMGFQQTTRYTYVIEDLSNLEFVWRETRENIKREVRKARKKLVVRSDLNLEVFLEPNEKTFERKGLPLPYTRELVQRIDHACQENDCRRVFFAQDSQGQVHGAVYIVWDEQSAYYLMGGADSELRNSGVSSLLLWEAIQFAATVTKSFDFEGSMMQSVERFFRAFGAKQKPYIEVTKTNSLSIKVKQDVRSWLELWRGR